MDIRFRKYYYLLMLLPLTACEVKRDNPNDPLSPNFSEISTQLTVRELHSPFAGIAGVNCSEFARGLSGTTDLLGTLIWQHTSASEFTIVLSKHGYFTDTMQVEPKFTQNQFTFTLNAQPQIGNLVFVSNRAEDVTTLSISASVTDANGRTDISEVFLRADAVAFRDTLVFRESDFYSKTIPLSDIPGNYNASSIPELSFNLQVNNTNRDSVVSENFRIVRVIQGDLVPLRPNIDLDETGTILFQWTSPELDYDHGIYLELRSLSPQAVLGRFGPFPPGTEEFLLTDSDILDNMADGTYFWLLQVIDNPDNTLDSQVELFRYFQGG
jgi:hypothetical protein